MEALAGGEDCNDLYAVDLDAAAWRNLSGEAQGAIPSRRAFHAMASTGKMVYLFGGSNPGGVWATERGLAGIRFEFRPFCFAGSRFGALNDFYSLDPEFVIWTRIGFNASKAIIPPPRCGHGLASSGQLIFIFGGSESCFNAGSNGDVALMP